MQSSEEEPKDIPEALVKTHDTTPEALDRVRSTGKEWQALYRRGVLVSDFVVLVVTCLAAQFLRFGFGSEKRAVGPVSVDYTQLGLAIAIMWWISLQVFQTGDSRVLGGEDFTEYSRVIRATVLFFGTFATLALIFKWDMSRGFLAIVGSPWTPQTPCGAKGLAGVAQEPPSHAGSISRTCSSSVDSSRLERSPRPSRNIATQAFR